MDNNVDLMSSLEDILTAKVKFHSDQIATHEEAKKQALKALSDLRSANDASSIESHRNTFSQKKGSERNVSVISQTIIKPMVIDYLKRGQKLTTAQIFDFISIMVDVTNEPRRSWVTAISLALNTLCKSGKVTKTDDPNNGNIKYYQWNENV